MTISRDQLLEEMKRTAALLEGHFLLSSGLHSPQYMQCAKLLQYPAVAERVGLALGELVRDYDVDVVAAPAIGGILVAHEAARALGVRGVFSEREGGVMTFRRGLDIGRGERVAAVEDVVTTGGSMKETIRAALERGAEVVVTGCIVDRSGGKAELGYPLKSLLRVTIPTFQPEHCPLCRDGVPLVKPGSRLRTGPNKS